MSTKQKCLPSSWPCSGLPRTQTPQQTRVLMLYLEVKSQAHKSEGTWKQGREGRKKNQAGALPGWSTVPHGGSWLLTTRDLLKQWRDSGEGVLCPAPTGGVAWPAWVCQEGETWGRGGRDEPERREA